MPHASSLEFRLLDEFQRDFPLVPSPYAVLARALDASEQGVISALEHLASEGAISRIGAVFRPGAVGKSTLAALAVPPDALEAVAQFVGAFPEVSHNYERENAFNLWFVATAADARRLNALLTVIEVKTGHRVLRLPLLEEYHIDLGFRLGARNDSRRDSARPPASPAPARLDMQEQRLVAALQQGLALVPQPFAALGAACGLAEEGIIDTIARWQACGIIRRFGVIVRHRELGFEANAMAVWDVPDDRAGEAGRLLARVPQVTLAYRRARSLPDWPYNVYCMVHGRKRSEVEATLAAATRETGLEAYPRAVLFSRRRFKQAGARSGREETACTPSIA